MMMMMMMKVLMVMNCFCRIADLQKALRFIPSCDYFQKFSPWPTLDLPQEGFELAHNLSSCLIE